MKVLIVGAGIAGLSLSAHLKISGYEVVIVERAEKIQTHGFVLGLWGAGLKTLEEFQINENIKSVGHFPTRFDLRDKDGKVLRRFDFSRLIDKYGQAVTLLRNDFQKILLDINKGQKIILNTSIKSLHQSKDDVTVVFTNGHEEKFDLVVGADGIHSKTRELIFGEGFVKYSGLTSWIYMLPDSDHFKTNVTEIWSGDKFFGAYPFKEKRLCVIFALKASKGMYSDTQDKISLLRKEFGDFGWIVKDVLNSMTNREGIFHTDWNEVEIKNWQDKRVVLIGDAAHSMLPTAGSGASMALEDSFWLANEIRANPDNLILAVENFCLRRNKAVRELKGHTDLMGRIIGLSGPLAVVRNFFIGLIPEGLIHKDLAYLMTIQDKKYMSDYYAIKTVWEFDKQKSDVCSTLFEIKNWPQWWKFVKSSKFGDIVDGKTRVHVVFGFWQYQLDFDIYEDQISSDEIGGSVVGDLFGNANVKVIKEGNRTKVIFKWQVLVERPWIRKASKFMHPLFSFAHSYAMESGAKGLAKELGCRLVSSKSVKID